MTHPELVQNMLQESQSLPPSDIGGLNNGLGSRVNNGAVNLDFNTPAVGIKLHDDIESNKIGNNINIGLESMLGNSLDNNGSLLNSKFAHDNWVKSRNWTFGKHY